VGANPTLQASIFMSETPKPMGYDRNNRPINIGDVVRVTYGAQAGKLGKILGFTSPVDPESVRNLFRDVLIKCGSDKWTVYCGEIECFWKDSDAAWKIHNGTYTIPTNGVYNMSASMSNVSGSP
jgi:hypothetical protein